ncbi:hypothetical protein B9Z55_026826 [Caenorhabditis nigoni]|uniref:F-box domain-containing protein n=1 Tax=Caenorhabditis nigoni TaxID=1611254 RepID=A0A2G5SHL1_9PELO|nr:hypothetical protein B9Z55_026826 [Caenorhabditis nigoni]
MTTLPNLEDMPNVVLSNIFEKTGISGILKFRKVSRSFREFLEVSPMNSGIIQMNFSVFRDLISLKFYEKDSENLEISGIQYSKSGENNCEIRYGNSGKALKDSEYSNRFFEDLKIILTYQKSIINILQFVCPVPFFISNYQEFVRKFQKTLENFKLKVKIFHMQHSNFEDIFGILKNLDSREIEEISIFSMTAEQSNNKEIDNWVNLDQWKMAKRLKIRNVSMDQSIIDFLHFEEVHIELRTISANDMILVAQKFLTSPIPKDYCIEYLDFPDESKFSDFLGPQNVVNEENSAKIVFQSTEDENYLRFCRCFLANVEENS